MEAQSKKRRRDHDDAGDDAGCSAGDRLSALPDCLLLHVIMSRLKARQVVQTSVLSRRWTSLWRSVPCLDVDQEEFKAAAAAAAHEAANHQWGRFERFTDHLLIRRNVGVALLDTFRLHVGDPKWADEAARWIRHIVKYGAPDHHHLRRSLAAASNASWNLKTLHLSNVRLDDRLAEHIRSRCPSLEDVWLKGCVCDIHEIASLSLRKLFLESCVCNRLAAITSPKLEWLNIYYGRYIGDCPLAVVAPALDYMAVSVSECPGGVHLEKTPSLDHVFIDLLGNKVTPLEQNMPGIDYHKLLDSVSSVSFLELARFVAVEYTAALPEFKNLRALSVTGCRLTADFETLFRHFLRSSPNLELLIVHCCGTFTCACPGADILSDELSITEIMYIEEEQLLQQVKLLLNVSGENYIKLTKVGPISFDQSLENLLHGPRAVGKMTVVYHGKKLEEEEG